MGTRIRLYLRRYRRFSESGKNRRISGQGIRALGFAALALAVIVAAFVLGTAALLDLRQKQVDLAADKAAANAALCLNEEAYEKGIIKLDRVAAERAAEDTVKLDLQGKNYKMKVEFIDSEYKVRVIVASGRARAESVYGYARPD